MSFRKQATVAREPQNKKRPPRPSLFGVYLPDEVIPEPALHLLAPGQSTGGRDVESPDGIPIPDLSASRAHFSLMVHGAETTISDTSSHGTYVNRKRLEKPTPLVDGDMIRAGSSLFIYRLQPPNRQDAEITELIGVSPAMGELRSIVSKVGPSDATVLILGSSGTGKEVVARCLHSRSNLKGKFLAVNCAAIPESLAESQLFGHVAGAFTGARSDSPGLFAQAHGGTLFLDEVGELSPAVQAKLLRVLEAREIWPVGAKSGKKVKVRILAATLRNLRELVKEGSFREDLYSRLAEITVTTPNLAEHREDILTLAKLRLGDRVLTPELAEALVSYHWPLNVRELFKLAKELEVFGEEGKHLDLELVEHRLEPAPEALLASGKPDAKKSAPDSSAAKEASAAGATTADPPRARVTKESLRTLLTQKNGSIADVARELGRSRKQIYRYLEEFDLNVDDFRR